MKLLPATMGTIAVNNMYDKVILNIGFVAATIICTYGKAERKADLTIICNSTMVAMMNSVLNNPIMGGMMNDGKTKTITVEGYKAKMEKQNGGDEGKTDFKPQVPLANASITFK